MSHPFINFRYLRTDRSILIAVFFLLLLTARAQDNSSAHMPAGFIAVAEENGVLPRPDDVKKTVATVSKPETPEVWERDLLRDPFWPVGFYPPNWQRKSEVQSGADIGGSSWKAASTKLQISGTSQLGDRAVAIINGELKGEGDKVEALHDGRIYQWEIVGIDAEGQIQLKKLGIR